MKLITSIYKINSIKLLSEYVDGFIISNEAFGTRLTKSFSIDEINEIIKTAVSLKKEIFINANQMFTDDELKEFTISLSKLDLKSVNGIIVADLGAFLTLKELGFTKKVIYNPETLLTNPYDANFLASYQIKGVYLAKEITLNDINVIAKSKKCELFLVGHGHLNMFYSKRQLITNYLEYIKSEVKLHNLQDLRIVEELREDEYYPILEDKAGTHVFRANVLNSLDHLDELEQMIDYLVIDPIFKDDLYLKLLLPLYHQRKTNQEVINKIKEKYQETWDEGFFFRKTIYQKKVQND